MQTPEENREQANEPIEAPPALVAAFRRLPREVPFVPRTVDNAVLEAARRHLMKPERPRLWWLPGTFWVPAWSWRGARILAGCATVVVLAAALLWLSRPGSNRPGGNLAREDLNGDGQVDILDAFALARRLEGGKSGDVIRGRQMDQRDIAVIAAHAVSLERRRGS